MAVEEQLLVAISRIDAFCSDYWWAVMSLMISLLAIITTVITVNRDDKHIK